MKSNAVEYRNLVSQANFYCNGTVEERYMGMAIGNGVTGSMVWTEPDKLKFQINRSDVFATNGATTAANPDMASPEYLGKWEYCGGCSFFDITFDDCVFTKENTIQQLNIYDADLEIIARDITVKIKVWAEHDVFCIDVVDHRTHKKPINLVLSMLRDKHVKRKNHFADSYVIKQYDQIGLNQEFSEKCSTGITENDHYCASSVLATTTGCDIVETKISDDGKSVVLKATPEGETYSVFLSSGASFLNAEQASMAAKKMLEYAFLCNREEIDRTHKEWWHNYWGKSYIDTPCNPKFSFYWYTYLYYIGSTMRGKYPAKYNGLLFCCDGDTRSWGGQFWWYNQSRSHYGLDAANHGDMNYPLFNMLLNAIPKYQKACEQIWGGHGGIILPETEGFSGPEVLLEEIATDLRNVLLYDKAVTDELMEFMSNRSGMNSRWCIFMWKGQQEKKDALSFRWHSNLSYNAGDAANSMWNHYLYTLDNNDLKQIYPWIKGVAEFYRFYPCKTYGEDGYMHFNHLGWAESITHATDVIDDLVMMKGIFPIAIKASELLGIDEDLRSAWLEAEKQIPPYPTSDMEDSISNRCHTNGLKTYAVARKPCQMEWPGNTNDCRLRMLQNFDIVTLETRKHKPDEFATANNSFEATEVGQKLINGELPDFNGFVWNRGLVEAARLGRTDVVRSGLPVLVGQFSQHGNTPKSHYPNRMPWTNGSESYSIQELGIFSDQLQEPLLQSISNGPGDDNIVIYVFPAWPLEWEASFELLAKGGFLVESQMKDSKIAYIKIYSQNGGICRLHNPWKDRDAKIICSSKNNLICFEKTDNNDTLLFFTEKGEGYSIC